MHSSQDASDIVAGRYPLQGCGRFSGKCPEVMARTSMALGLLDMPEILAEYQALGRAIVQRQKKGP